MNDFDKLIYDLKALFYQAAAEKEQAVIEQDFGRAARIRSEMEKFKQTLQHVQRNLRVGG